MKEQQMSETSPKTKLTFPPPAPVKYAGQWVAWNRERTTIIAHGDDFRQVHQAALAAGHPHAIFQVVRHPGVAFIGMA
jgi:chitodextrinase